MKRILFTVFGVAGVLAAFGSLFAAWACWTGRQTLPAIVLAAAGVVFGTVAIMWWSTLKDQAGQEETPANRDLGELVAKTSGLAVASVRLDGTVSSRTSVNAVVHVFERGFCAMDGGKTWWFPAGEIRDVVLRGDGSVMVALEGSTLVISSGRLAAIRMLHKRLSALVAAA